MVVLRSLQVIILSSLFWIARASVAIAHPLHELESPDLFFGSSELTPTLCLVGLGIAFTFGAVHALAPGHGKTMVAAYLVGNRGTAKHAVLLGIVTTISHTLSVLFLAILALVASRYVVPEQLYPVLSTLSGLTVLGVGLWLLRQSWLSQGKISLDFKNPEHSHPPTHIHSHGTHEHAGEAPPPADAPAAVGQSDLATAILDPAESTCSCGHAHTPIPDQLSLQSLIALGVAGGMVPCPSALVLLLSAIAFHQVTYGLVLVVGFSFGLASVLIALGLIVVYAKRWFEQLPNQSSWFQYLPMASASVIILTGVMLTGYALLPQVVDVGS